VSKRVRRRIGEAKGQTEIGNQWISIPREMVESPALRVRSPALVLVMLRIEAEHMAHGGAENGRLIVTHRQFEDWGVHHDSIAPAIREGWALGFFEVSPGHAGVGGNGQANRFRLTYVNDKHGVEPTHEWQRITTIDEAKRIAKEARAEKDPRAQALGERSAKVNRQRKISVPVSAQTYPGFRDRESNNEVPDAGSTMHRSRIPGALSIFRTGDDEGTLRTLPPGLVGLQWSAPRRALPSTVWPIEGSYRANDRRLDVFAAPRHVVRNGGLFQ
jgi:hypothetical protein